MAASDYQGFEAADHTVVWRYMPAERFMDLLDGKLYFAAARQFEDTFEGSITQAQKALRERSMKRLPSDNTTLQRALGELSTAFADLRRMTKISCWHAASEENAAMWDRYRPSQGGAVAVVSSVGALKRSLQEFRLQSKYGVEPIVVGTVRYIDYENEEMADSSMLGIFMHKRCEYRDEREIRALLSLRVASEFGVEIPNDGVTASVDARELIADIRAAPDATATELSELAEAASRAQLRCPVRPSTLARRPIY